MTGKQSGQYQVPRWLKCVNKLMIAFSKLGFGGDTGTLVVTVPGRKTGKLRSTPVAPMKIEGHRYIVGGWAGGDWAANARAAGEGLTQQGRRKQRVRFVEIPADQAGSLLRHFAVQVPSSAGFMRNAGLVTGPNPDEYEALAGRCPVFRLDPV